MMPRARHFVDAGQIEAFHHGVKRGAWLGAIGTALFIVVAWRIFGCPA